MFDISFGELLVCLVVALVVIGPEQLPQTVRSIGLWIGRMKRSLQDTRSELERQLGADDIRRQLHNEDIMRSIEKTRSLMEKTIQEGGEGLRAALDESNNTEAINNNTDPANAIAPDAITDTHNSAATTSSDMPVTAADLATTTDNNAADAQADHQASADKITRNERGE